MISNRDWVANAKCANLVLAGILIFTAGLFLGACNSAKKTKTVAQADINTETKFSSKEYGVEGSPRITTKKRVPKGGGVYKVGKPYKIRGKTYYPKEDPNYVKTGMASWYGPNFHGRLTANGEIYDQYALSAAHPTMPLPSYARVTNLENGSSVMVRVNDRGPYAHNRIIDLSAQAAKMLGYKHDGLAKVKVEYVGKARMDGLDEEFLMASYNPTGKRNGILPALLGSRTLVAQADTGTRTTLDQYSSTTAVSYSSVAIPTSRPATMHGIPMPLDVFLASRGESLLSGYADDNAADFRIDQAFAFFDEELVLSQIEQNSPGTPDELDPPSVGMKDLVKITFGPYRTAAELESVETELSNHGLATQIGDKLILTAAKEEINVILHSLSAVGITSP